MRVFTLFIFFACKKSVSNEQPPSDNFNVNGNIIIYAEVSDAWSYAILNDTLHHPINNGIIKINNRALVRDTIINLYYNDSVKFKKLNNYYLEFSASGYGYGNGSLLGLTIDSIKITYPPIGTHYEPGSNINVSWQYIGGNNDGKVGFAFVPSNAIAESTLVIQDTLPSNATSYTIPSSKTKTCGKYSIGIGSYKTIGSSSSVFVVSTTNSKLGLFIMYAFGSDYKVSIGDTNYWQGGTSKNESWEFNRLGYGCIMKLGNYKAFVYPFPPNNDTLINLDSIIVVKGSLITPDSIFGRWKKIYSNVVIDSGEFWGKRMPVISEQLSKRLFSK
jgi:hypothetical protein